MKRTGVVKFPNSVQLFKFCQKVLSDQRGEKVHDQEVGTILSFNPSDCSHWKRGEKNVKSVFAFARLSEVLQVEAALIHDVAGGVIKLEEAYFEYQQTKALKNLHKEYALLNQDDVRTVRSRVEKFVVSLHKQTDFTTPPLYLPEVMRFFSFISTQALDMIDRLSRILRVKPGQYSVQFKKGDLKPQTRMSIALDLAKIIFEGERTRFPELGPINGNTLFFEEMFFAANLLLPRKLLLAELLKLDNRKNLVAELATIFWVPKSLVSFQMQELVRSEEKFIQPLAPQKAFTEDTISAIRSVDKGTFA